MVMRAAAVMGSLVLAACAGTPAGDPVEPPRSEFLSAGPVIRGGLLSAGADAVRAPAPFGPFTPLRQPIAVAGAGADVYIADAALGMLLRFDPHANQLVRFPGVAARHGIRLAVDRDLSLYVLDPAARRIVRFAKDGTLLTGFPTDATVASLSDFAIDAAHGRLLAVDSLHRHLVAFHPLGRAFQVLALRAEARYGLVSPDAIALAPDALYAVDRRCACLARISYDGRVLSTFGHKRVLQPDRIAADHHGRLFVSDRADRTLKVFVGEQLEETVPLAGFGLMDATDLTFSDGWLYVADGLGAQVRMLRVQPPTANDAPAKP